MKVFLERQFINRWWLFMIILAVIIIVVGTAYYSTRDAEEGTAVTASVISLLICVPLVIALLYLRLETRIDEKGVLTWFKPFGFTRKYFAWEEIDEIYLRNYNPVTEYGGWGIRGIGQNDKAYNIRGNTGIQIITKEGNRFLIGTHKPKEAEQAILPYKQTTINYET